jgi:hypothetical protein
VPSGKPEETCGAFVKKRNGPCGLPRGWGTAHPGSGHCKWHFGNTSSGVKTAAKEAGLRILKYTNPIEIDPTTALLQELHRTAGMVQYLDSKIQRWKLDTDEEIPDGQQQWLRVHREERRHMVNVAKLSLDAGIAEREVQLAEQQGMLLASAIEQILDRLNLTPAQTNLIPEVVPAVLRAVSIRTDPREITNG